MTEHLHELAPKPWAMTPEVALAAALEQQLVLGLAAEDVIKRLAAMGFTIVPLKDGW